jgi:hypothetical protein
MGHWWDSAANNPRGAYCDIIDELCVGPDGLGEHSILTALHAAPDTVADAIHLAEQLTGEFAGAVEVVEL